MARRRRSSELPELTDRERRELVGGLPAIRMIGAPNGWSERSEFPSLEAKRAAWFTHRDELMELFEGTCRRPSGWWLYEAAGRWDHEPGREWPGSWEQAELLRQMGELPSERDPEAA